MKISQLSLEGRGAWPDLHVDPLHSQLNVFFGAPQAGKSTIARLLGQLLYGKTDSLWRKQFGQTIPLTEGTLTVESEQGNYLLRRHRDTANQEKLTIASTDGNLVDSQTMRRMLSNLTPELTSQLFAVDFAESPPVEWLLSDTFSRLYTASQNPDDHHSFCCNNLSATNQPTKVDRRRIEELVGRRDAIAKEIEHQLALRRKESGVLEHELNDVDIALKEKRELREELQDQLRAVEKNLAEIEVRLRYFSLEATTRSSETKSESVFQQQLEELEAEISRCRQALGDLSSRESVLRNELAQLTADGTADTVTCLADGRTTLTVMERLLDDLDAEVAQIARANQPGRCVSYDTHAKLSPVAEMLRLQVYTLCGQLTEQERIARRQQFAVESRQLARAQTDLGERLEQLLSRRESIIQQSRQVGQPMLLMPQPPASDHCNCDRHGNFVDSAEVMQLGSRNRQQYESSIQQRRATLGQQRDKLTAELANLQHELLQLENRWKHLQNERAGLIGGASLEENQTELERLEQLINQELQEHTPPSISNSWRASDVLAQLTDGQLVQIHLNRHGQRASIVDRSGNTLAIETLSPAQHDAVYLALTLALVSSYADNGIHLPLLLDEPFLRQDSSAAAAMAGVLEEFSRTGHQLFVFTEDLHARRRFASLNTQLFDLEVIRNRPVAVPETISTAPTQKSTHINTRIVRQSLNGTTSSSLRLAPIEENSDYLFYLSETSSFDNFPILGESTTKIFASINIHTIGDLLAADASNVATQLDRQEIGSQAVLLWQSHMGLMCYIPEVTLNDAQILSASGIVSPEDFFNLDTDSLLQLTSKFLASKAGQKFAPTRNRYTRSQLSDWLQGAKKYRDRWNQSKNRYTWPRPATTNRRKTTAQATAARPQYRFYLERSNDIEAAPSIGPKTAKRFAKVGIRTVADLLNADPESTAEKLDTSHINAKTIAAWQHQARLVCCIPDLRGYGAQLFVACGYTEPDQIAEDDVDEVIENLLNFCNTKKGQRILRNGDSPSRSDIQAWIDSAAHTRPLEAA